MGRVFSVMAENVAADIQDTSTSMIALIKRYINRRYMQVLRAVNFEYIDDDYTINVVAGTDKYTLPTDFKSELFVLDTTNNTYLDRTNWGDLARYYPASISTSGSIDRYIIYTDENNDKKIKFHYTPSTACVVSMPYVATPALLSADTDEPVLGLEDLLELGATADAWRYKRQFAKASALEVLFKQMYEDFIFAQDNQPNNITQFKPATYSRDNIY